MTSRVLTIKKLIWYYQEETKLGSRLKKHIHKIQLEYDISNDAAEKKLIAQIIHEKQEELRRIEDK